MTTYLPLLNEIVESVSLRKVRYPDDENLPWFDYTALKEINECPTWGMIHGVEQLHMPGNARAMALEAGSASHEFYAAVRLYDLLKSHPKHVYHHGPRLFGSKTWDNMTAHLRFKEDEHTAGVNFALQALYDSGFYDDPQDRRRTMSNIEEACIAYYDKWPWHVHPVYVEDDEDPTSVIGVEIGLEFVVEFTLKDGGVVAYRYRGRADGLHRDRTGRLALQENKTASRLDDAWSASFVTSHQLTGYCVGVGLYVGEDCSRGKVWGMAIPLPRTYDYGGIVDEPFTREPFQIAQWIQWVWDTTRVYEQFKNKIDEATRYTHSCNRYFRPCALMPYCGSDDVERAQMLTEFERRDWNPIAEKARD